MLWIVIQIDYLQPLSCAHWSSRLGKIRLWYWLLGEKISGRFNRVIAVFLKSFFPPAGLIHWEVGLPHGVGVKAGNISRQRKIPAGNSASLRKPRSSSSSRWFGLLLPLIGRLDDICNHTDNDHKNDKFQQKPSLRGDTLFLIWFRCVAAAHPGNGISHLGISHDILHIVVIHNAKLALS